MGWGPRPARGVRRSSAPAGLQAWLRRLGLYFGLANLIVALPFLATGAIEAVDFAALGGVAVLAGWWTWVYLTGRVGVPADAVVGVALLTVGWGLGSPGRVLGVYAAVAVFRSLYGPRADVWAAGALHACAFTAAMLLAHDASGLLQFTELLPAAGLVLLGAPMLHSVASAVYVHERAAGYARALADAGVALLSATDPAAIAGTGLRFTERLLHRHGGQSLSLALIDGEDLVIAARSDSREAPPLGARVASRTLPEPVRQRLTGNEPFLTRRLDARSASPTAALDMDAPAMMLVPLNSRGTLRGVILIGVPGSSGGLDDYTEALQALAAQVAFTLDNAALTADLMVSETRFRSLVQNSSDVISVIDRAGIVGYCSPTVNRVLGYAPAALTGYQFDALVHPQDADSWRSFLTRVVATRAPATLSCRLRQRTRGWRHTEIVAANLLDEPGVAGVVLNIRDVSERKVLEDELVHRAYHDPLTGLPNRSLFLERVRKALSSASRPGSLALLFIDLDGFKSINDGLGHAAGDGVLLVVAARLRECLREGDTAARLSGDEFAVLVDRLELTDNAADIGRRVLEALSQPCTVNRQNVKIRASVGVAVGGGGGGVEDAEDLLHRADLAMYAAKGGGKNRVEVFQPNAEATLNDRRALQAELQSAVLRGQLEVRYQPIVSLHDGRVTSAEALVRWQHPVRGLLGPDAFIPLAEEGGLIGEVFDVVLREACGQARKWEAARRESGEFVSVAVNLSAVQLHQPELVDSVTQVLADTGLPPRLLTLEITETSLVSNLTLAIETLATLKQLGVRIAIDDFGTGYSSLAYLRRLPADVLKVDKVFVNGVDSHEAAALAHTIIDLGRQLGMPTVAEGVERVEQRDALRKLGCTHGQGYLFSRPVSGERMSAIVAAEHLQPV